MTEAGIIAAEGLSADTVLARAAAASSAASSFALLSAASGAAASDTADDSDDAEAPAARGPSSMDILSSFKFASRPLPPLPSCNPSSRLGL